MKINTYLDCDPLVPEVNNDPSKVMIAGYTPDDLRIKELLLAGKRLEAFKLGDKFVDPDYDFDAGDEVPENYDTLDDFMDEMEAQDLYNQVSQRVEASIKEREELYSRRLREEKAQKEQAQPVPEPTKETE